MTITPERTRRFRPSRAACRRESRNRRRAASACPPPRARGCTGRCADWRCDTRTVSSSSARIALRPVAMFGDDPVARLVEQVDPVRDEAAFAGRGAVEALRQRGMRRRRTSRGPSPRSRATSSCVTANSSAAETPWRPPPSLERRDEIGDVAHDEDLARRRYRRSARDRPGCPSRRSPSRSGLCPSRKFGPALALARPVVVAEAAIAVEEVGKVGHARFFASVSAGAGKRARQSLSGGP